MGKSRRRQPPHRVEGDDVTKRKEKRAERRSVSPPTEDLGGPSSRAPANPPSSDAGGPSDARKYDPPQKPPKPKRAPAELICQLCKETKPRADFAQSERRVREKGHAGRCKRCKASQTLESRYDITLDTKERMFEEQGRQCDACAKPLASLSAAHVDHCHGTKVVRGLLCSECNTALGLLYDNFAFMGGLVGYLARHKQRDIDDIDTAFEAILKLSDDPTTRVPRPSTRLSRAGGTGSGRPDSRGLDGRPS